MLLKTKNPEKRIILHIDFDSFFASVEQQANPTLRNKPIAVTGSSIRRGIACAASREAKEFGVKTAMPIFKAREICPDIIAIKGDASKYIYIQHESLKIFNKYTDLVEPFSIDEAFLDVTETAGLFGSAENIAHLIKRDLREKVGPYVTCSMGIGPNKLIAKLVSSINKPDGVFVVTEGNLDGVLKAAELQDFCGIGPRLESRLNKLGVCTVEQLQKVPLHTLYQEFGNVSGTFMKNASLGVNFDRVKSIDYERPVKSISHQHTLYKNTKDPHVIRMNLRNLSEMVAKRMRKHNVVGRVIFMGLRSANFAFYFDNTKVHRYTNSGREIFGRVEKMFGRTGWSKETRLVCVGVSEIISERNRTMPLFLEDQRKQKINETIDIINDRWGDFTIIPANTMLADQTKSKISSFLKHS